MKVNLVKKNFNSILSEINSILITELKFIILIQFITYRFHIESCYRMLISIYRIRCLRHKAWISLDLHSEYQCSISAFAVPLRYVCPAIYILQPYLNIKFTFHSKLRFSSASQHKPDDTLILHVLIAMFYSDSHYSTIIYCQNIKYLIFSNEMTNFFN